MSAICIGFESSTNKGSFCISRPSEISKLPTTINSGRQELKNISPVNDGSACLITETSEVYILNGTTNIWNKI